jgi:DNA-directed RNA polymerase I and III subunit RPAC1
VLINKNNVGNVSSTDYPGNYQNIDDSWNLESFKQGFTAIITSLSPKTIEFDLIGIDPSFSNAFRRIMLSEVPTMAIETVFVLQNTSIMADEVLSHRLGLIPLNIDPRHFHIRENNEDATDVNTVVLSLHAHCRLKNADAVVDEEKYIDSNILSSAITWVPQGDQQERGIVGGVVNGEILINKLRLGQEVDLQLHAVKGVGKDHAKFSPVALCSYRLLPEIQILHPITGPSAKKFQSCFPTGVISISESGHAVVSNPRKDTVSREVLRHAEFDGKVKLTRVRDHFIFNVESVGALGADVIFLESVGILRDKCVGLLDALENLE